MYPNIMNKPKTNTSPASKSWDTYWQGTADVGAYSGGGASHPAIRTFWIDFFKTTYKNYTKPVAIDIASGNGAVLECALEVFGADWDNLNCVDISTAAIANISQRFPRVTATVADASNIPFEDAGYDIVSSQFGVEYAGKEAIYEAARLVAGGGRLALLLHTDAGSIHQECCESLDAIERLQKSEFIPRAIEMFQTGFSAVAGAERKAYDAAADNLAPAITAVESILKQYGPQVAGDTIAKLYNDVAQIHQRIQRYDAEEVLNWLNKMESELLAYAERMSSMGEAAIDQQAFTDISNSLESQNFSIERAEPFTIPEQELAMAWILIATKQNS